MSGKEQTRQSARRAKADAKRALQLAREASIEIGAIEALPDGTIRIVAMNAVAMTAPGDEFAKWEARL